MPTYAYACKSCGNAFDIVQSFSDASLTECPECGGVLRKQFGNIGVTFNGSGFYRNDSRAGEKGTKAKKTADAGASGSSSSGSSDSGSSSGSSGSGSSGSGSSSSSGGSSSGAGSSGSGGGSGSTLSSSKPAAKSAPSSSGS